MTRRLATFLKHAIFTFCLGTVAATTAAPPAAPAGDPAAHATAPVAAPKPAPIKPVAVPAATAQNPNPKSLWWQKEAPWWWISPLGTLLGFLISTWIIVWRIHVEHEKKLELQRSQARDELNLRIFNAIADCVAVANRAASDSGMWAFSLPDALQNYMQLFDEHQKLGAFKPAPIKQRTPEFMNLSRELGSRIADVFFCLERHEIAIPKFKIFRLALMETMRTRQDAFFALFDDLLKILPMDIPNGPTHVPPAPTPAEFQRIKGLCDAYHQVTDDIGCYLSDLIIEAQNHLLGDLYLGQHARKRVPGDPTRHVVISTDDDEIRKLVEHFRRNSRNPHHIRDEDWIVAQPNR